MGILLRRLQVLLNRRRFESDLEEELRDHLARRSAETGSNAQALRLFGNVTAIKEESRKQWTWNLGEQLAQDVRYGWRAMAANKLFTAMAVLSLALGIGANTAIYSFMDAVMLRALPVRNPEELVIVNWRAKAPPPVVHGHWGSNYDEPGAGIASPNFPYPAFELLRDRNQVFSSLFGYAHGGRLTLVVDKQAQIAQGEYVSGDYFSGLGVPAAIGRVIGKDDDRSGAPAVAVLAYDFWRSRFGANEAVIGRSIQINGARFTIAGVAAPEFQGVVPNVKPGVFIPLAHIGLLQLQRDWLTRFQDGHFYWIEIMGRLKPGVTLATAQSEAAGQFRNFVLSTATTAREQATLPQIWLQEGGSGVDSLRREISQPLILLMGMVGLILLISCANVANLLLARAASRRREMAVRLSLGAGRFRIIRQLLTESVMLALAGAAGGLGIASLGINLLRSLLAQGEDEFTLHVGIDWRVLAFTLIVAVVTGILFGVAPALQATRVNFSSALKEARASEPRGRSRWGVLFGLGQALVVLQIGISLLLVVASGLFVRTLVNLHAVNLGFNAEKVLLFNLDASKAGYKDAALNRFYRDVESRLQSIPGVRGATTSDMPLVAGWMSSTGISVPGIPNPPEGQQGPSTSYARVGTTFFETLGIPILAGRAIGKGDVEGAPAVAVVNQIFAAKYFPGVNPLGRHFKLGLKEASTDLEIVGVAQTARYDSLKREIPPVTYTSWQQKLENHGVEEMFFEVRASGDPLALGTAVRRLVAEVSPLVPVTGMTTQQRRIDQTILAERTFAQLCTCFGALALLMACVGLYGTVAYGVARRTNEIGIRMALGAERRQILWMVLREVMGLSVAGVVLGFAGVYGGTSLVKSLLFGLKPNDPVALAGSIAVLLGCSLLAGILPARRASRIDPLRALRHE